MRQQTAVAADYATASPGRGSLAGRHLRPATARAVQLELPRLRAGHAGPAVDRSRERQELGHRCFCLRLSHKWSASERGAFPGD